MGIYRIRGKISCLVFLSIFLIASKATSTQITVSSIQDLMRHRIEGGGVPVKIYIDQEVIYSSIVLPVFYEKRVYRPAWIDPETDFHNAVSLLNIIREVDREGLRPGDYHLEKIVMILSELQGLQKRQKPLNPDQLVDMDLLLTDAFLILGSHLLFGKINPQTVDPQWYVNHRKRDMAQLLENALALNQIEGTLYSLLPGHKGYAYLRRALALYRQISEKGGWPAVSKGPDLQKADRNDRIPALRQRLAADGFIETQSVKDGTLFDDALEQALLKFQQLNGLETDGILGAQTLQALNISAEQRVRQIIVNMERWRWLPQDWGRRYVLVNIAGFNLDVIENENLVMNMRVIAGRPYRRTPVFSDRVTYLIHILYWTVWLSNDNLINFSPDIYGRDSALDAALRQPRPAASG